MIINFSNLGGGGGGGYVLPIAASNRLGGVKIGQGVNIDSGGTISVEVADSSVLKSVSELPSTAETGDVMAVAADNSIGVYQYDGSEWQQIGSGSGSYVAGDYIQISGDTISVTGVTSEAHSEEVEEVIAGAMAELNSYVGMVPVKQTRYTAATPDEMYAISGVNEGDVCIVLPYTLTLSDEEKESVYYSLVNGVNNPIIALNYNGYVADAVKITLIQNPNWDEVDRFTTDYYLARSFKDYTQAVAGYGPYKASGVNGWRYQTDNYREGAQPTANWQMLNLGDSAIVKPLPESDGWYLFSEEVPDNPGYMYESTGNTYYPEMLRIEPYYLSRTYQFNEGKWVRLVDEGALVSLDARVSNVEGAVNTKLSTNEVSVTSWSDLEYQSGFMGNLTVNQVSQGIRLHAPGAVTDYTNPRVDQITTSNSFLRFIKLTQEEYDLIQVPDPLVCYIIVEEE